MRRRLVKILLILIIAIFSIQLKVHAAVITSTDKQVQSNSGNVTISVNSKQALGAYTLKITDTAGLEVVDASGGEISADKKTITYASSSGTTNLGTYTFKVPTVTNDTTYRIKFLVSGMETTDLETIADESNTAVLTVKAPVTPKPDPTPTPTPTPEPTPEPEPEKKSSEARLKNFGINPKEYDFSGFKKDKTDYSVEVPNNVTEVEIYAEPLHEKATVTGDGKVTLNEGNNKVGVKVTAEDGTEKTYTLTIKRKTAAEEEKEQGENRLKSLSIKPKEYDFSGFDSEITEYSVEVPNEVEQIEILATAMDSNAQITGAGIIDIEEGENELKIEVIAVNGDKKTYTLTVTRLEAEETEAFGLKTLTIEGIKLNPSFKTDIYEYTAELTEDITSLEIGTRPTDDTAKVEVIGGENLKDGENVITILVTNKETEEVVTYQIIVNKNVTPVVAVTEETSWLKPSTWGKEEKIKILIIIVLILLIIWAIVLKSKISKENKKAKKVDLPGAEELDRAIAEHQELVEEKNYEQNDFEEDKIQENKVEMNYNEQNYIEEIAKDRFGNMDDEDIEKPKRRGRHF